MVVVDFKANCPLVGTGPVGGVSSVGGLSKRFQPVFTTVWEKTTENSKQIDRKERPVIEAGTSRLPSLSDETLCHWWIQLCYKRLRSK